MPCETWSSSLFVFVAFRSPIPVAETPPDSARFWPQWRGPQATGVAPHGTPPLEWSETKNIRWKVAIPGRGSATPIVWDDRIFLTTAEDGGRRLSLLSYRRSDGKLLWKTAVQQKGIERGHGKNGHASATPITDGQLIYASFGTHGLVAMDFDGKIMWQSEVGTLDNYHGSAGSPISYKDKVILYLHGGVVHLPTGQVDPHDPDQLITKITRGSLSSRPSTRRAASVFGAPNAPRAPVGERRSLSTPMGEMSSSSRAKAM